MSMTNFIEEKMRELDKKFAYLGDAQGDGGSYILVTEIHKEKLKYFFRQSIEEAVAKDRKKLSTLKSEVEGMKKEGSLTCRACGTGLLGPAYGMGKVSFELQCKVCGNYQEENEDVKEYNSALQQVINLIEKHKNEG